MEFRIVHHSEIDSTNSEAWRLAQAGARAGTVVVADRQTAGRGRHGRTWQAEPGNLLVSILLRPDVALAESGQLAFVTGLAVADACDAFAPGAAVALKWPNDVIANDAKLGGILIESEPAGDRLGYAVAGIGLNLAWAPAQLDYPAIALAELAGKTADRDAFLDRLLNALALRLEQWQGGFTIIRAAWLARAWRFGEAIELRDGGLVKRGRFDGIDADGALLLDEDGRTSRCVAGSVAYGAAA